MQARALYSILVASLSTVFFGWLFYRDFSYFSLPLFLMRELYVLTFLFFAVSMVPLLIIRSRDRKYPVEMNRLRVMVSIIVGYLWIADGILQAQPQMPFGFSHFVLQSSIDSLPGAASQVLSPLLVAWNSNEIIFDSLAAAVQLFIGTALIVTRSRLMTGRVAILSTLWALGIWVIGEGMGNIFLPDLSLISGFPGAALIYAIASILLITSLDGRDFARALGIMMAAIFIAAAAIQALPFEGFWKYNALASIPGGFVLSFQPRAVGGVLLYIAYAFQHHWVLWNIMFTVVFLLIGITWIYRPRIASFATVLFMPFPWIAGQDLGVFGMYGTDFNSALPIILLSIAMLLSSMGRSTVAKDDARPTAGQESG